LVAASVHGEKPAGDLKPVRERNVCIGLRSRRGGLCSPVAACAPSCGYSRRPRRGELGRGPFYDPQTFSFPGSRIGAACWARVAWTYIGVDVGFSTLSEETHQSAAGIFGWATSCLVWASHGLGLAFGCQVYARCNYLAGRISGTRGTRRFFCFPLGGGLRRGRGNGVNGR